MRVIAGKARRIQLKTLEGMDIRPTTDRIKETLFNILAPDIPDCSFLDLFSGSGAIGIEALSRGARKAVFVDNSPMAAECIKENLETTHLSEHGRIIKSDCFQALHILESEGWYFDVIFLDPPYLKQIEKQVLQHLEKSPLLNKDTLIIVEASKQTEFSYLEAGNYTIQKEKVYKTNKHIFLKRL